MLLGIIILLILSLFLYCALRVASESDQLEEESFENNIVVSNKV